MTVLALVLLPILAEAFAGGGGGASAAGHGVDAGDQSLPLTIFITLAKVAVFAGLAMMFGPRIVPWVSRTVARTGSRELFTLTVLALAVGHCLWLG